eukprot:1878564-Lingulodinium_polyedra.AAC.1
MLVSQVRRGCTVLPADASGEHPGDDEDEEDQSPRPPRAGRIAVWENALKSGCRECREGAPRGLTRGRASEQGQHPE